MTQRSAPKGAPAVAATAIDHDDTAEVRSRVANYGRVPFSLLFDSRVTAEELRLYAYLTTFDFKHKGEVWPGRQLAAKDLGWSVRTVDRHLSALARRGAIARHQAGAGRPSWIELLADVDPLPALPDMAALPNLALSDVAALPSEGLSLATSLHDAPLIERERTRERALENPQELSDDEVIDALRRCYPRAERDEWERLIAFARDRGLSPAGLRTLAQTTGEITPSGLRKAVDERHQRKRTYDPDALSRRSS